MQFPVSWMISVLKTTAGRWQALAEALPEELARRRPAAGQWAADECLQHMIDVEKLYQSRLQAFLAGQDFPAFNPDEEGTQPGQASLQFLAGEFARLRAETLVALAQVTEPDYGRQVRHAELGPVTLEQLLNTWAAHDLNHTVQAERAIMQPFIQSSGPWHIYFTDHAVPAG